MILYARVENYRSIGERQELNFMSSTDKAHFETLISEGSSNILPVIPIYGGNATGKTNILKFLKTLSEIIRGELTIEKAYDPCKFTDKVDTIFEVFFYKKNIKYYYKLDYNKNNISAECLYYYPNGKISKIFEKKNNSYTFGTNFESLLKNYSVDISNNVNFLFTISTFLKGKSEYIDEVISFFKDDFIFINFKDDKDELEKSKEFFKENLNKDKLKSFIEYFYQHLNIGAKKISFETQFSNSQKKELLENLIKNKKILSSILKQGFNKNSKKNGIHLEAELDVNNLKNILFNDTTTLSLIYEINKKEISIPIEEESKGIQKIFILGTPIADALYNNKIVIFDELELGFHPLLSRKIIELFLDKQTKAQLIFTTHNTTLLDLDLFRRDQIYFVSRTSETKFQSIFNSLGSINGIRKSTDIERAYLEGKYCSTPNFNNFKNDELIGEILCPPEV